METTKLSLSEAMAAMATSTNAAENAAGITEIGGSTGYEPAWRGDSGPEDKQRLKGSIVLLKSGKFAYLPVSPPGLVRMVLKRRTFRNPTRNDARRHDRHRPAGAPQELVYPR